MEIKFRGKIKYNGNHRFSGDWVYGYYLYDQNTEIHYIKENDDVDGLGTSFEVIPESVGQFTGLKDINKVDIYLGDIVKGFLEQIAVIKFGGYSVNGSDFYSNYTDAGFYMEYIKDEETSNIEVDTYNIEVIGNTTDNPELLEH